MGLFAQSDPALLLGDLLDQEKEALLTANFASLEKLTNEIARLMGSVGALRHVRDAGYLTVIRRKATRNQKLLEAAGRGISAAKDKIRNRNTRSQHLQTYDKSGTSVVHSIGQSRHERKA